MPHSCGLKVPPEIRRHPAASRRTCAWPRVFRAERRQDSVHERQRDFPRVTSCSRLTSRKDRFPAGVPSSAEHFRACACCGAKWVFHGPEVDAPMNYLDMAGIVVVDGEGRAAGVISLSDIGLVEEPHLAGEPLRAVARREALSTETPARTPSVASPFDSHERSAQPAVEWRAPSTSKSVVRQ